LKVFCTDGFVLPLPEGHRFPVAKYALLRQRVVEAGLVPPDDLCVPLAATDEELLRAHDAEYLRRVVGGELTPARRPAHQPAMVAAVGGACPALVRRDD
jgi:acetoin utilization deacetylase AcuC-like enzyme